MTLLIRRAKVSDALAMARHMSDPAVFGGLLQMPYPSEEAWTKRLTDGLNATGADVLLIAERDGELLGAAGLNAVGGHVRRRHAMGLGIHVSTQAQGQGVGSALMTALCDYADRWAGVLRIELLVYADNERAIRLYRKFGFELEGTMRAHALRDGVYVDSLAMARLHPNPPALPPR
ncbi:MAG: GNAT family N-acetyltransferase [Burkholderiales bacterium]